MPAANVPLQALGGRGAKEWDNLVRYMGVSLAWFAWDHTSRGLCGLEWRSRIRAPGTGEFYIPFFTRGISLLMPSP